MDRYYLDFRPTGFTVTRFLWLAAIIAGKEQFLNHNFY